MATTVLIGLSGLPVQLASMPAGAWWRRLMECFNNVFDAILRQFYVYNFWLLSLCQSIDLMAAILNNRPRNVTLIFEQQPVLPFVLIALPPRKFPTQEQVRHFPRQERLRL
jgi:hypothetical protein